MQKASCGVDLSIQDLTKDFKQGHILQNFSLDIKSGEFVSLLGPSGSGKSTLLRLIAELDQPTSGRVRLSDTRAQKSFVFQESNLLPWRNLRQNLQLVFELTGQSVNNDRISEVLNLVGLQSDEQKYPSQLSGGMRMRASVARALLTRPSLLLLDEPFSSLDENTRHRLQEELYDIWLKEKMTVVFVTHSISEALFLSQRAVVLGGYPARIVLDHRVNLPTLRDASLRSDLVYISEVKTVAESFDL